MQESNASQLGYQIENSNNGFAQITNTESQAVFVPSELSESYKALSPEERQWWLGIERKVDNNRRDYIIRFGTILKEIKDKTSRQGNRDKDKITFERWIKAHHVSKGNAYNAINIAQAYYRIKAQNDPDEELMLDNYLSLPKMAQLAIATGKADPEQEKYLLHATVEARSSRIWQEMAKSISKKNELAKSQSDKIQKLNSENQRLANRLADVENSRAEIMNELNDLREGKRHLEMQLEEQKNKEPELVEVAPDDYDELKADKEEAESLLADREEKLKKVKAELKAAQESGQQVDDLARQVNDLIQKNNALRTQIKQQESVESKHDEAFKRVSSFSSEMLANLVKDFDLMQVLPETKFLSQKDLAQTDLVKLAEMFESKGSEIREKLLATHDSKQVIDGEFKEA
jgi:vacuolar-type H+-ATPase subunit I/STV1